MEAGEKLIRLREKIDEIDEKIVELLNKRAEIAVEIGNIKKELGLPVFIPARESEVYDKIKNLARNGIFPIDSLLYIFREIVSVCVSLQKKVKVAFLGPMGTFTHEAAMSYFGLGVDFVPVKFVEGVFEEVARDHVSFGVVPIENSVEGIVSRTLDAFMDFPDVTIVGEIYLKISHNLLTKSGEINNVKKIYSHPHAISQCKKWLSSVLPEVEIVYTSSTAEAAKIASEEYSAGAVASELAATLYGLKVAVKGIEDMEDNYTRFVILGKGFREFTGSDKTSLFMSLIDEVGALKKALTVFADNGINLTRIESRPSRKKPWDYVFYIDFEGHIEEDRVKRVFLGLEKLKIEYRILGSYPKWRNLS
ncbi:MAG: prephenate dehydratase [Thermosulfidibacteraceae bacterium]|jgi:chorismate mutase/prephenate dehydratase